MWATAIAAGVPNELFWEITPQELAEILKQKREQERAAYLRAGLVAATIVNVNRKRGSRMVQPSDFIRELPRDEDFMDVEEAVAMMDRWAKTTNQLAQAEQVEGLVRGPEEVG